MALGLLAWTSMIMAYRPAIGFFDIDCVHGLARRRIFTEDHFYRLATEIAAQNRMIASFERWLLNIEFVWIDSTLNHGFAETPG